MKGRNTISNLITEKTDVGKINFINVVPAYVPLEKQKPENLKNFKSIRSIKTIKPIVVATNETKTIKSFKK
jgi:hypothetical protein